jgi:serine/threonine-protein kinase
MDPANARVPTPVTFTDGLGDRHHTDGPSGEPLEVLTLRKDLTTVPAFEFALRERVSRLAGFNHDCFGPVRGISRLGTDASSLALVSDRVTGDRLSTILTVADRELIPLEIGAALALIQQLVDAVAVLHETVRDACHGAIALERIVIAPDARLVLVEHVLGGALGSLQYSRDRYWKELRVALPPTAGAPHFDRRADVTQVGAIALALITGRPLGDSDYPDRVSEIVSRIGAVSASGGLEPLPPAFRAWLSRALQLDPRQSFASAIEAREELHRVLAEAKYAASAANLAGFLTQVRSLSVTSAPAIAKPIAFPSASRIPAPASSIKRPASSPSQTVQKPAPRIPEPIRPASQTSAAAARVAPRKAKLPSRRFVVAVSLFALVASMGTLTARTYLTPVEVPPAETGTLLVNSNPVGASVTIDGRPRGKTPLSLAMMPGEHRVELVGEYGARSAPVFVLADGYVVQFIELPKAPGSETAAASEPPPAAEAAKPAESAPVAAAAAAPPTIAEAAPASGWIAVAAPIDLRVYLNRKLIGSSRTRLVAPAGRHDIEIVNESLGYKAMRTVNVSAGKVSTVTIDVPKGSLSVNALPWAEVSIDGEPVGETPMANVALAIGSHQVVFRHPELGERRHTVVVTATAPARLSVDMRTK